MSNIKPMSGCEGSSPILSPSHPKTPSPHPPRHCRVSTLSYNEEERDDSARDVMPSVSATPPPSGSEFGGVDQIFEGLPIIKERAFPPPRGLPLSEPSPTSQNLSVMSCSVNWICMEEPPVEEPMERATLPSQATMISSSRYPPSQPVPSSNENSRFRPQEVAHVLPITIHQSASRSFSMFDNAKVSRSHTRSVSLTSHRSISFLSLCDQKVEEDRAHNKRERRKKRQERKQKKREAELAEQAQQAESFTSSLVQSTTGVVMVYPDEMILEDVDPLDKPAVGKNSGNEEVNPRGVAPPPPPPPPAAPEPPVVVSARRSSTLSRSVSPEHTMSDIDNGLAVDHRRHGVDSANAPDDDTVSSHRFFFERAKSKLIRGRGSGSDEETNSHASGCNDVHNQNGSREEHLPFHSPAPLSSSGETEVKSEASETNEPVHVVPSTVESQSTSDSAITALEPVAQTIPLASLVSPRASRRRRGERRSSTVSPRSAGRSNKSKKGGDSTRKSKKLLKSLVSGSMFVDSDVPVTTAAPNTSS